MKKLFSNTHLENPNLEQPSEIAIFASFCNNLLEIGTFTNSRKAAISVFFKNKEGICSSFDFLGSHVSFNLKNTYRFHQ